MFLFCLFFVFEKGLDTSDNNFVCETTSCEIKNLIPICVSNSLPLFYCHCFYYYYNQNCYNCFQTFTFDHSFWTMDENDKRYAGDNISWQLSHSLSTSKLQCFIQLKEQTNKQQQKATENKFE